MDVFAPGAALMGGKYRLERLVVDHGGVTVWEATDVHSGRLVQLSVFEHASTMLDHGRMDRGTFVVFDVPPRATPRLELVEISEEDAFFDEPPAPELFDIPMSSPKRAWLWAAAAFSCVLIGLGGLYVARARTPATGVATITEAAIPVPTIATTPQPIATPPPPPTAAPSAERDARPPAAPKRHKPVRAAPRPKPPLPAPVTPSEPLTL